MKFINTTKLIGLLALLVFLYPSCKEDDVCTTPSFECEDFPERQGGGIFGPIIQRPNQRKSPCFNPNNPNEFVYVKIENNFKSLVKSNITTGEQVVLLENANIVGQPSWGNNNIIAFTLSDLRVYLLDTRDLKIKALTQSLESNHPKIYQDSFILFTVFAETIEGASGLKRINLNGQRLDSIQVGDLKGYNMTVSLFDCSNDFVYGVFGNEQNYGIYSIDYENRTLEALSTKPFEGNNNIVGVSSFRNDFILYSTYRTGLFKISIAAKKESCIKKSCDSRSYRHLSVSPEGTKLLAERVDATDYRPDDGGWTEESKIVIMNIDGSDERVLLE